MSALNTCTTIQITFPGHCYKGTPHKTNQSLTYHHECAWELRHCSTEGVQLITTIIRTYSCAKICLITRTHTSATAMCLCQLSHPQYKRPSCGNLDTSIRIMYVVYKFTNLTHWLPNIYQTSFIIHMNIHTIWLSAFITSGTQLAIWCPNIHWLENQDPMTSNTRRETPYYAAHPVVTT
jgi:hypothetical protein